VWLASQSVEAVSSFYDSSPRTLTWADLLASAGELPSSRGPTQLWAVSAATRRQARRLPHGVQACARGSSRGLYLLLEVDGGKIALTRDDRTGKTLSAPRPCSHEQLLDRLRDMARLEDEEEVDLLGLDQALGEIVGSWLDSSGYGRDVEITVLAAIHVLNIGTNTKL